jgi:23S rRNA-/tRNA-specific pseudouridylate synthase
MIRPYPYTFTSHAKKRWVGRAVLDVYAEEFQSYPVSYYERCLEDGRITVNGSVVPTSYRIRGGDVLRHLVHRHEPAVRVSRGGPPLVRVVAETPDCLAVDKPPCLPIHPCGGYNENSLQRILEGDMQEREREREREHGGGHQQLRRHDVGDGQLRMVHRLDRLTSGLVVLAKSSRSASRWTDAIRSRDGCQKLYLARVRGRFPDHLAATAARQRASPPGEARQPPRPPRLAAEDRGGSSSPRLPDHGEWPDGEIGQEEPATEGSALRRRAANGWWISDALGVPVSNAPPELWPPSSSSDSDRDPTEERLGEILKVLSEQFASSSSGSQSGPAAGVGDAAERPAESDGKQPRPFYWVHLACPIRIVDPKVGAYECGPFDGLDDAEHARTVKPAQTSFCALSYHPESDSTLVLCRPQTGRTHQIRLHLLRLGHPIANDPNYGGDAWYYDAPGREACRRAQALLDADGSGNNRSIRSGESSDPPPSSLVTSDEPATEREMEACAGLPPRADGEPVEAFLARTCVWCRRNASGRQDRAALELLVRSSGIWLHALQYSARLAPEEGSPSGAGEVVAYRTPLPAWSALGASDGRSAEATCDNRQRRRSDDLSIAMNDSR